MKKELLTSFSILSILFGLLHSVSLAGEDGKLRKRSQTSILEYKTLDGNRISCYFSNDGVIGLHPSGQLSGLNWPQGSGYTALYAACPWIAGIERSSGVVRAALGYTISDFAPGTINGIYTGSSSVAASQNDSVFRIYKISKSDSFGGANPDYLHWPASQGAPVNPDGTPKFYGDQQLFYVVNDLDTVARKKMTNCPPLGMEIRVLAWCINDDSFLKDVMFVRWEIINKSTFTYDQTHAGVFADFDLGFSGDDNTVCDSLGAGGFIYNEDEIDRARTGEIRWPAAGLVLLDGPSRTSWGSPMTSFLPGLKNMGGYLSDLPYGNSTNAAMAYNFLRGLDNDGLPLVDPTTGRPTAFMLAGDPITATGWIPSVPWPRKGLVRPIYPSDKRVLPSSGPCTFAPGDTIRLTAAIILGQGEDRLSSFSKVRFLSRNLQSHYPQKLSGTPEASVSSKVSFPSATESTIHLRAATRMISQAEASLVRQDGSIASVLQLYDDGAHDDSLASDGIFAGSTTMSPIRSALRADLRFATIAMDTLSYLGAACRLTTSRPPVLERLNVLTDNINGDGIINPGEIATATMTLSNPSTFSYDSLSITALGPYVMGTRSVSQLPVGAAMISTNGAFGVSVPKTVPTGIPLFDSFVIVEPTRLNRWFDSLSFTVQSLAETFTPVEVATRHIQGNATGSPAIRLVTPSLWKDQEYRVVFPRSLYYSVVHGVTGDTLTSPTWLWDDVSVPFVDGFRVAPGTVRSYDGRCVGVYETRNSYGKSVAPAPSQDQNDPGLSVYQRPNSTGEWSAACWIVEQPASLELIGENIGRDDFEIRFTEKGSEYYAGSSKTALAKAPDRVPFEIWDIQETPEDPTDDLRNSIWILDRNGDGKWTPAADTTMSEPIFSDMAGYMEPVPSSASFYFTRVANLVFIRGLGENFSVPKTGTIVRVVSGKSPRPNDIYAFNPVKLNESVTPGSFTLWRNYPNPFNPATTIGYHLYRRSHVTLKIYDLLGREIRTIVDGPQEIGDYRPQWDGTSSGGVRVASGVYFYRLTTNTQTEIKKMLLIR